MLNSEAKKPSPVIIVFGVPLKRTPIAPIYFHTTPTATTRIKP
ncbi:MAG: hypothetical protein ACTSVB_01490 [Candidatus Heimdallarchaeaceae archaeon]